MAKRRKAGALESETLALLWAAEEPLSPAQVLEQLPGALAYTTVATILSRLVAKGLVQRVPRGRAWATGRRRPLRVHRQADAPPAGAGRRRRRVLARFVDDLDPSEEQVLRSLLDSHLPEGELSGADKHGRGPGRSGGGDGDRRAGRTPSPARTRAVVLTGAAVGSALSWLCVLGVLAAPLVSPRHRARPHRLPTRESRSTTPRRWPCRRWPPPLGRHFGVSGGGGQAALAGRPRPVAARPSARRLHRRWRGRRAQRPGFRRRPARLPRSDCCQLGHVRRPRR